MLKSARCAVAGLMVLATGCADVRAQNVAQMTAEVAPFHHLRGVRIGMPFDELKEVRPRVQRLEDFLYGEVVDDYQLHYTLPVPYPYDSGDGLRLKDVRAVLEFTSESSAVEAWRGRVPSFAHDWARRRSVSR